MSSFVLPPWSFTMLEMFANCRKQAFHRYILKEKGPQTPAMIEGNALDKAMEDRLLRGVALAEKWQAYEPFAASVVNRAPGVKLHCQLKVGLKADFTPCAFFDAGVWGRGVLDVLLVNAPAATIIDWKTGKNNEAKSYSNHGLQIKIFALFVFKHFPRVNQITAFNIYLKTGEIGKPYVFRRDEQELLWRELLPKVIEMEKAFKAMAWPPMPGPLCGYCDVTACPHNRKG